MDLATLVLGGLGGVALSLISNIVSAHFRETKQFHVAALLVRDEIRGNISRLEIALDVPELPDGLESQTYREMQLILASRLPTKDLDAVRAAYVHVRVPRTMEEAVKRLGPFTRNQVDTLPRVEMIEAAFTRATQAYEVLGAHVPKSSAEI